MAAPKRNPDQILSDRRVIAERYLRGDHQADIARDLNLSQQQVSYDLKAIRAEWLASTLRDFDDAKAQELAKIDAVELEFWRAWERSQKNKHITYSEESDKGARQGERSEGQAGNPAFLDGVLKCIERRCKILGLDAANKQEISGANGTPLTVAITEVIIERTIRDK